MSGTLEAVEIEGPVGRIEGLWKGASGTRRGSAVFGHPHPLHGGTMHNKVVYRAVRALTAAGWETLRFNFRGVGLSEGRHDAGRGEVEDFRSALDAAASRGGLPILAGGFSFGSAVALRAVAGDRRIAAFVGVGLPVGSAVAESLPLPSPGLPSLFVVGESDTFGPPAALRAWLAPAAHARVVEIPGADHFFGRRLPDLEAAIFDFASSIANPGFQIGGVAP